MPDIPVFAHSPEHTVGQEIVRDLGCRLEASGFGEYAAARDRALASEFSETAAFTLRGGGWEFVRRSSFGSRRACKDLLHEIVYRTFPEFDRDAALVEPLGAAEKQKFAASGVVAIGEIITEAQRLDILQELSKHPVFNGHIAGCSDGQPRWIGTGEDRAELYSFGSYDENTIAHIPHVLDIALLPALLSFVKAYFGVPPVLLDLHLWWSFPNPTKFGPQPRAGQQFHRDYRALQDVQFFVCLSDSDDDDGRHEYFSGTHDPAIFAPIVSTLPAFSNVPLDSVLATVFFPPGDGYGQDERWIEILRSRLETVPIRARHAFMIDTMGLHRGAPPTRDRRLVMSVRFAASGAEAAVCERFNGGPPLTELDYTISAYRNKVLRPAA